MDRAREYAVRLFLAALNERYRRSFEPGDFAGPTVVATDEDAHTLTVAVGELVEPNESWDERRRELAARLDEKHPGSYLLWQPPGAALPDPEDEPEWLERVTFTASKLASGRTGEARLPVRMALGKVKDEGGYASVTGGLSRQWVEFSGRLQGSFYLDSRGLNRLTRDEDERTALYNQIIELSHGLSAGEVVTFEHDDAWPLQRLARGPAATGLTDGWALTGCPPGFRPENGGAVRRLLRRCMADAVEALKGAPRPHALVLVGAFDYMDYEIVGPSLRGFDPSLAAAFDAIALVTDAQVKLLRAGAGLGFEAS